MSFGTCWVAAMALFLVLPFSSAAQEARNPEQPPVDIAQLSRSMTYYYQRPSDPLALLRQWERLAQEPRDAMLGFLAALFIKDPGLIDSFTRAQLERKSQVMVIQALRLAGRLPEAIGAAAGWGWPQNQIAHITEIRRLGQAPAEHPRSFDVLWAASFAIGDAAYLRPIYEYYAAVAAQPGVDVHDIVTAVLAKQRNDKAALEALGKKYPREALLRVVFASSALWSLEIECPAAQIRGRSTRPHHQ